MPGEQGLATDHALAALSAGGDTSAFTELVRRHERRVRSFLARLSKGRHADDLAQDTFLQAWRMAASFRGQGSYEGWLLRIAWRTFLSDLRANREVEDDRHHVAQTVAPSDGVKLDIDRALASLGPTERAAALLCYAQGCSHSEAADILELPLGTLKSTVARARARLAASLEGYEP